MKRDYFQQSKMASSPLAKPTSVKMLLTENYRQALIRNNLLDFVLSFPETFPQTIDKLAGLQNYRDPKKMSGDTKQRNYGSYQQEYFRLDNNPGVDKSTDSNGRKAAVLENRLRLQPLIRNFHRSADTLTNRINTNIDLLGREDTIVIAAAHQPNLFAYSGVFKKMVVMEMAKNIIETKNIGKSVATIFFIVDHDFAEDRYTVSSRLPTMKFAKGSMELKMNLKYHDKLKMPSRLPAPTRGVIENWKSSILKWIKSSEEWKRTATRPRKTSLSLSLAEPLTFTSIASCYPMDRQRILENFHALWERVVEPAYTHASTYSDFNSFIMSAIANSEWGYSTMFVRMTEAASIFEVEYKKILRNFSKYSAALQSSETILHNYGIRTGVGHASLSMCPLWYECPCGGKASVKINLTTSNADSREAKNIQLKGNCLSCHMLHQINLGDSVHLELLTQHAAKLFPRAIPIPMLMSEGLGVSMYVSGIGGLGYILDTKVVADALSFRMPIITAWSSKDIIHGMHQTDARNTLARFGLQEGQKLLEFLENAESEINLLVDEIRSIIQEMRSSLKNNDNKPDPKLLADLFQKKSKVRSIRRQRTIINRALDVLNIQPSIIDYVINWGLRESNHFWEDHLITDDGNLYSPIEISKERLK